MLLSTQEPSDEELVECFQAGDQSAFDILYQRYYQGLYGYIAHATDRHQGEDLAQDAFEIALNNLPFLKDGKCFKVWLYQIATNRMKDWARRAKLLSWLPWRVVKEGSITEAVCLEHFEKKVEQEDFIRQVMCNVSKKYRVCIYLDIFLEMRQHEIASLLNMRERTVRRYIAKGKAELRAVYVRLIDEVP